MVDPHQAANSTEATEASASPHVRQASWLKRQWKRRGRKLLLVTYGLIVVAVLSIGYLLHIENFALDFQAYWDRELPPGAPQVVIVSISREDYESDTLFKARSPLDPARLKDLVHKILEGKPAVLGVDIDTADKSFRSIRDAVLSPRIIWARDAQLLEAERGAPNAGAILGGESDSAFPGESGLAVLLEDSEDSVIRRYQRAATTSTGTLATFPWAIAKRYAELKTHAKTATPRVDTTAFYIRYTDIPPRASYSASKILAPGFEWNGGIQDKVVLLGGRYDRADLHKTPYGETDGVDVISNAVETELSGRVQKSVGPVVLTLIGLVALLVLIAFFRLRIFQNRFWWALLLSLIGIVVLATVLALMDYVPTLPYAFVFAVMVLLTEVIDRMLSHGKDQLSFSGKLARNAESNSSSVNE